MAYRMRKGWAYVLVVALLVLAMHEGRTQQEVPLPPPRFGGPAPLPPPPTAAEVAKVIEAQPAKPLSKQETDGIIERVFGSDSAELKRPTRLWLSDIDMAIAAKEAILGRDGRSVRFVEVSLALPDDSKILRGAECTITFDQPIMDISDMGSRTVSTVEMRGKNGMMMLTPQGGGVGVQTVMRSIPVQVPIARSLPAAPPMAAQAIQPKRAVDMRFTFKLDPKAPLADLLPSPAKALTKLPIPFNEDLTKVPEVTFGEPISKESAKQEAMEATAHTMAKINHLNLKKTDGFMLAMLDKRADLRGMPFLMGEECRTREDQARVFAKVAEAIQQTLRSMKGGDNGPEGRELLSILALSLADGKQNTELRGSQEMIHRAMVAAMTQILMPESETIRVTLAKSLATIPHIDATKALARLAIFSPEDDVRAAAIEGLKLRRERDYTDVLVQGFRYPLPVVAKRSAEALVKLERKDVLADLIDVLEQPDPRLPVTEKRDGKEVTMVRELVKVNHHRNCLLCHAPGNTESTPEAVLKVAVPLPTEPLPKPSDGGGYEKSPPTSDIVVRLDMTYLRQDFSLMMPVADAHPWPEMQRFDFLVRSRTVTPTEAQSYEARREADEPGRPPVYHRAALLALRELSGRDTEPTPQAWRRLLNIAKRS